MVFLYNRTPYTSLNKLEDVYQHMSSENLRRKYRMYSFNTDGKHAN